MATASDSKHVNLSGLQLTSSVCHWQLLENANEFIIHGYAYRDWVREIPDPHNTVAMMAPVGGVDLNRAMSVVYNEVCKL